ncbi:MAG: hypothetical protein H6709_10355 [Kofleriaceae bacterium]|nr:hypothetical protein [Myxococcales bacterium]MCB9564155.1 hypothetical protein [Kofleriaceae bacterium]MCB9572477.1 hypothetical protein [Kofleriaceae bacterium]
MTRQARVEIGDQAYLEDGGEEVGAVREVHPTELVVYVEGAGDFVVPATAVRDVHHGKIILDFEALAPAMRAAVQHAHDAESE